MNRPPIVDLSLELLAALGNVRTRRMFGGWGLYAGDAFVGLILNEQLYLKTRPQSAPVLAAAGCQPFTHSAKGRTVTIGFWSAPAEAMDSPAAMEPWARLALQAALAGRSTGSARRRRSG